MAEWIIEVKDGKFPIGKWTELVRCKDCKWFRNDFDQHYCCLSAIDCPLSNDYCSRGERKSEGEE